jgi:anti-sigma regulatory factor (Ser/Thr protein kinase)
MDRANISATGGGKKSGGSNSPLEDENRTFTFRSRPEAVSAARRALDGLEDRLDASVFYDASLCLSELVTNAVLHSGAGDDDELELRVALAGDTLRVTVIDDGSGFDPPRPSGGDESGWGLYIVDRLSHNWGVERARHTAVWFEMRAVADGVSEPEPMEAGNEANGELQGRHTAFARLGWAR